MNYNVLTADDQLSNFEINTPVEGSAPQIIEFDDSEHS